MDWSTRGLDNSRTAQLADTDSVDKVTYRVISIIYI